MSAPLSTPSNNTGTPASLNMTLERQSQQGEYKSSSSQSQPLGFSLFDDDDEEEEKRILQLVLVRQEKRKIVQHQHI